ncbi:sodium:proline symporter [Acinetobacter sp. LoGeW2-3]|uniref:sodium:solute symporter family transporter n=1 Tax=Acinetobacter sp. LoGeW2-3 TaxID=1808001 RepID=UPI000C05B196|nr:sodium/solute symporter [Acinetobacter sp. LoGeW2-3]ATO20707.1 sodium:proline symporter [Acinetobacter sp. LoGeW2-3]
MSSLNPTLITFMFYIVAMIGIGLYAYCATSNFDEYILGGRSLGSVVTALSAGASDMSGWLLMGLPGAIYLSGLSEVWIAIGLIIGAWLNWLLVAGRLRAHTEFQNNALTLPDYFTSRFADKKRILRLLSAIVILVFFAIYCASGMVAGARYASNMLEGLSFVAIISSLAWGLGYFGQPHILVRFMAADSVKTIPAARRIGMTWMILCLVGAMFAGYIGIAYFAANPDLPAAAIVNQNPETVFMELTKILFNPWIAGIILAAILAAIMSTLSCQLLVCSTTLTEDLYKGFLRKNASQKELIWVGRGMVIVIALIAISLAINPNSKVLGLVAYAWAGFGAAFGPLIIFSLFWKRMTLNGAIVGMVVGAVTVIAWKNYTGDTGLYEIIPGFILAALSIVIVSLLDKAPSHDVVNRFELAKAEYQKEMAEMNK